MRTKRVLVAMSLMYLSLLGAGDVQTVVNPSKGLTLANDFVELKFEPAGMGLESMIDLKTGYNHIRPVKGRHLLLFRPSLSGRF